MHQSYFIRLHLSRPWGWGKPSVLSLEWNEVVCFGVCRAPLRFSAAVSAARNAEVCFHTVGASCSQMATYSHLGNGFGNQARSERIRLRCCVTLMTRSTLKVDVPFEFIKMPCIRTLNANMVDQSWTPRLQLCFLSLLLSLLFFSFSSLFFFSLSLFFPLVTLVLVLFFSLLFFLLFFIILFYTLSLSLSILLCVTCLLILLFSLLFYSSLYISSLCSGANGINSCPTGTAPSCHCPGCDWCDWSRPSRIASVQSI